MKDKTVWLNMDLRVPNLTLLAWHARYGKTLFNKKSLKIIVANDNE